MKKHAKLWIAAAALLLAGAILLGRLPERWTAARFQRQCRAADVERIALRLQEMGGGTEITVPDPAQKRQLLDAMGQLRSGGRRMKSPDHFWLAEQRVFRITLALDGGEDYDWQITVPDTAAPGHTCGYLYPREDWNFYPVSNAGALFAAAGAICGGEP